MSLGFESKLWSYRSKTVSAVLEPCNYRHIKGDDGYRGSTGRGWKGVLREESKCKTLGLQRSPIEPYAMIEIVHSSLTVAASHLRLFRT